MEERETLPPAAAEPLTVSQDILDRYRILVADDQEGITTLVERTIQRELGIETVAVTNGDDALRALEGDTFEVFVTDMMMPGVHGFELLRKAHEMCPGTDTVVMTGYPQDFPYVEALQSGAVDFINKPFQPSEFKAKLLRVIRERELLRELRMAESKYRSLFDSSTEGMVLLEGPEHAIRDVNRAFEQLCGRKREDLAGLPLLEVFSDEDSLRMNQWFEVCAKRGGGTMADLSLANSAGHPVYVDVTATFIENAIQPFVFLSFKDVTEKREIEHQLADAAQRDELTGLFNRRCFQHRIVWAVRHAEEQNLPLSLLMLDLDNFKACNDTHGHQVGDELLVALGDVISNSVRRTQTDAGFRCGGDEFNVLLQDTNAEGARVVAERIREAFAQIERYGTTLSIGVAIHAEGMREDEFIRRADEALYKAKGQGKDTVAFS